MRSRRAIAGFVVFVVWAFLVGAFALGDVHCYDPATGQQGIDALDDCAWYHPFGLSGQIEDDVVFGVSFAVLACLALIWWPYRPWRRRA